MNGSKKQRAKQLFRNKQFSDCKQVLLEIVDASDGHYESLCRLADVCVELGEYKNAKKYYQQSINENPTYPLVYMQFGILLTEYLNEDNFAATMYEKSIYFDSSNDLCWFNYGKLMFKEGNFEKAKEFYLKCSSERPCVYYHFAKLLLSMSTAAENSDYLQQAKEKFEKATSLQPNMAAYHHEYAVCLQKMSLYTQANKSFLKALKLTKNADILMLYDYANFLSVHCNDNEKAIKYLQIACDLDKNDKFSQVKARYLDLKADLEQSQCKKPDKIAYDSSLRLLVYGLEQNITYWDLNNITLQQLQNKTRIDIIVNIFGGTDRVDRLKQHFQRIISSNNNIKLVILSVYDSRLIIHALKTVRLYEYFVNADIVTSNVQQLVCPMTPITALAKKYNLNTSQEILFVDSVSKNIKLISKKCKTYHVSSEYVLNGLSIQHMNEIEQIVTGVAITSHYEYPTTLQLSRTSVPLNQINESVYISIKKEIRSMQSSSSIYVLPVIKWMLRHWQHRDYKDKFLYFAHKYQLIHRCKTKKWFFWILANILPKLMKLAPNDVEFTGRYASCLAFLKHYDAAEHYFKIAIEYGTLSLNYHQYAYFLFDQQRYVEAETYFGQAIETASVRWKYYAKSCLGYARTLAYLQQPIKAETYYKQAIRFEYQTGTMEYFYALFLFNKQRYNEAKTQFKIAVYHFPDTSTNHYWLSKTLLKLKQFQQSEYHSNEALKLNPNVKEIEMQVTAQCAEKVITGKHVPLRQTMLNGKTYLNPVLHFSDFIEKSEMERHRKEMQIIAENERYINLAMLPNIYYRYFNCHIKAVYHGKMKNLSMYFNDFFELRWDHKINKTYLVSKIYKARTDKADNVCSGNINGSHVSGMENYQIEFDRFWFDKVAVVTDKFSKYYDDFVANNMNDIRCLFKKDIESKLQHIIQVSSLQDLQLIMTNIQQLKQENKEFIKTLRTNNLNRYYPVFTHCAIFTIKALKYHIKSDKYIKQMVDSYISKNKIKNQFHDHDFLVSLIKKIVKTKQEN